jgi:outer membrane protein OmpA-like peptidoglycan-associated protein
MRLTLFYITLCALLSSCSTLVQLSTGSPTIIHALADQSDLPSPLSPVQSPALEITFPRDRFFVTNSQRTKLQKQAEQWRTSKAQIIIAGFTSAGSPPDHARSVSQRRAEAIRTILVEAGLESANLHAAGYGSDIPGHSGKDTVKLYQIGERIQ